MKLPPVFTPEVPYRSERRKSGRSLKSTAKDATKEREWEDEHQWLKIEEDIFVSLMSTYKDDFTNID